MRRVCFSVLDWEEFNEYFEGLLFRFFRKKQVYQQIENATLIGHHGYLKSIIFWMTFNIFRMHFLPLVSCVTTRLTIPKMGSSAPLICFLLVGLHIFHSFGPRIAFKHLATIQESHGLSTQSNAYSKSPKTRMKAVSIMQMLQ